MNIKKLKTTVAVLLLSLLVGCSNLSNINDSSVGKPLGWGGLSHLGVSAIAKEGSYKVGKELLDLSDDDAAMLSTGAACFAAVGYTMRERSARKTWDLSEWGADSIADAALPLAYCAYVLQYNHSFFGDFQMFYFIRNVFNHVDAFVKGALTSKTAWFYSSDGNMLLDCGPNSVAMLLSYFTGVKVHGTQLLDMYPDAFIWDISHVADSIKHEGYTPQIRKSNTIGKNNVYGVFHVRGNHWVFAIINNDTAEVYDPLTTSYVQRRQQFLNTVTYPNYVTLGNY